MKNNIIEVVKKIQAGDKDAFALLYEEFAKPVYFQVSNIVKNKQDIEDITASIFLTAFEKIGDLKNPEAFPSWLNKITVSKSTDYLRAESKALKDGMGATTSEDDFEEIDPKLIPDKALDNAETAQMIYEIIQKLPIQQRSCIYFYYYEGLKVSEIAEMLAVKESIVKTHLSLARAKIREELENSGNKDGLRLWMATPLMLIPILKLAFQNTRVPANLATEIVSNLDITTPLSAAPETLAGANSVSAGTTAATAGAGVSAKIIAAVVAGVVVVGGVIAGTVLLGNSDNEPVVTPSNVIAEASTPTPTATPISTPEIAPIYPIEVSEMPYTIVTSLYSKDVLYTGYWANDAPNDLGYYRNYNAARTADYYRNSPLWELRSAPALQYLQNSPLDDSIRAYVDSLFVPGEWVDGLVQGFGTLRWYSVVNQTVVDVNGLYYAPDSVKCDFHGYWEDNNTFVSDGNQYQYLDSMYNRLIIGFVDGLPDGQGYLSVMFDYICEIDDNHGSFPSERFYVVYNRGQLISAEKIRRGSNTEYITMIVDEDGGIHEP